jgi:hypothetical protein
MTGLGAQNRFDLNSRIFIEINPWSAINSRHSVIVKTLASASDSTCARDKFSTNMKYMKAIILIIVRIIPIFHHEKWDPRCDCL